MSLVFEARDATDHFAVFHRDDGGQQADFVGVGHSRGGVDIHALEINFRCIGLLHFGEDRFHLLARTAPGGLELNDFCFGTFRRCQGRGDQG